MAKKFINGENLVYALEQFEQQILEQIGDIQADINPATENDINAMFKELYEKK